jgi:hypothetical protein
LLRHRGLVRTVLSVCVFAGIVVPVRAQTSFFRSTHEFGTLAAFPKAIAVGDFNGDGVPDVVTAGGASFTIRLGHARLPFRLAPQIHFLEPDTDVSAVATGDFNGDGKLDLALADNVRHEIQVWLGAGDGTFEPHSRVAAPLDTDPQTLFRSIAVADLNGDNNLDLVVAGQGHVGLAVFLGAGDGTFQQAATPGVSGPVYSVAVGDLNGDGKPDIVTANPGTNALVVLLGNGDATFQVSFTSLPVMTPYAVALADLNGDGKLDVAVTGDTGQPVGSVTILTGKGDGTFDNAKKYDAGFDPFAIAIGDVNGDGIPDVVTTSLGLPLEDPSPGPTVFDYGSVNVMVGNGDGTFKAAQNFQVGLIPQEVVVTDFNADRKSDLVVLNSGSCTFSVLISNAGGQ